MKTQETETQNWAVVTGASSGIGHATAGLLLSQGRNVIALGRRLEKLESLRNLALGAEKLITVALDVRNPQQIEHFVEEQKKAGRKIDVLINNAGLAKGVDRLQTGSLQDWDEMIDTNIKGLLYMTRALLPDMIKNGAGDIVNLGSVAGRWTYPQGAVYCATKFAVRALTEGLRMDLLGTPIRVSNIEPGMVETEFSLVRLKSQEAADKVYAGMKPLTAKDVAETIGWILSRPKHITIQELVIFPTDQAGIGQVHRR